MCVVKVGAEEIVPNQGESKDQVTGILCGLSLNSLRELVEFAMCRPVTGLHCEIVGMSVSAWWDGGNVCV